MLELYPDRATRDEILDVWMRNLPQGVRDAMATLQMSEAEYRRRLETMLFGPLISVSPGTTVNPGRVEIDTNATWWPFAISTGSITVPTRPHEGEWRIIS